jgi:isochorismate hydrolase
VNEKADDDGVVAHFGGRPLRRADPLSALAAGWRPRRNEPLLLKNRYSLWASHPVEKVVPSDAVLVLAGVTTHRCVLATAVEAASRDLVCVVAADACATLNEGLHESALAVLAGGFAYVASTQEILQALNGERPQ